MKKFKTKKTTRVISLLLSLIFILSMSTTTVALDDSELISETAIDSSYSAVIGVGLVSYSGGMFIWTPATSNVEVRVTIGFTTYELTEFAGYAYFADPTPNIDSSAAVKLYEYVGGALELTPSSTMSIVI